MLYPLTFHPIFKERVWGGRNLERLYHKPLPSSVPIGESWEISDRPDDVSIIKNGQFAGKDLRWLMTNHRDDLLGEAKAQNGRFPLLIKLLDAQEKLSLQVHPPPHKAAKLGGEPKTELWYIADAAPGAELYVGLKHGVSRQEFVQKIQDGSVAECFHRVSVKPGDAMFLPSGRVHALGAGLVIFEIQQNSDTTYRVFDWNRVGLDNKPRALHVKESLQSIDFEDFEPALKSATGGSAGPVSARLLVDDPLFRVNAITTATRQSLPLTDAKLRIIGVVGGKAAISHKDHTLELSAGEFSLIPAILAEAVIHAEPGTTLLLVQPGIESL